MRPAPALLALLVVAGLGTDVVLTALAVEALPGAESRSGIRNQVRVNAFVEAEQARCWELSSDPALSRCDVAATFESALPEDVPDAWDSSAKPLAASALTAAARLALRCRCRSGVSLLSSTARNALIRYGTGTADEQAEWMALRVRLTSILAEGVHDHLVVSAAADASLLAASRVPSRRVEIADALRDALVTLASPRRRDQRLAREIACVATYRAEGALGMGGLRGHDQGAAALEVGRVLDACASQGSCTPMLEARGWITSESLQRDRESVERMSLPLAKALQTLTALPRRDDPAPDLEVAALR
ncbi:MAG: hypothetical protein K1X94_29430 [Sandaracinaceae bacterium]|nr:hypothetical protein [Sandaracinaceae bacterium]